ncbi:translocation/assembly module TamB domain-containing protein [Thermophagus sp. OGC60D27]|uniref:translocation/assembly module TamB domain-containing protein n=1 Tax=Thermophagus sp. OGC60D27 TaxID=3458415 RepID=UPI0040381303
MNKAIKYLLISFTAIVVVVLLLVLFAQTVAFHRIVKEQVVKALNKTINGEVRIESLEGNFYNQLSVSGLFVGTNQGDTLMAMDDLTLGYSLWPLLKGRVHLYSVRMVRPVVKLEQSADSLWNFEKLFPTTEVADEDSVTEPTSLSFVVKRLGITNGHVTLNFLGSPGPISISELNMDLGAQYSSRSMRLNLTHLGFETPEAFPDLKHLQFNAALKDSIFSLSDFALETKKNNIRANGDYSARQANGSELSLQSEPFDAEDLTWALPDFQIGVKPTLDLQTSLQDKDIKIDWLAEYEAQQIRLRGTITNFVGLLSDSLRHKAISDVDVTLKAFDPGKWFMLSDIPVILNGTIKVEGNGLEKSHLPLTLKADFSNSRWKNYPFKELKLGGSYLDGATEVNSRIVTRDGVFNVQGRAQFNDRQAPVQLRVRADRFPAGRFLPDWGDSTWVNMDLNIVGNGRSLSSLRAHFDLFLEESVVAGIPVDSLRAVGQMEKGDLTLDTLQIMNESVAFFGRGTYSNKGVLRADLFSRIKDLSAFHHYVAIPATWNSLELSGKAGGTVDSLSAEIHLKGQTLRYDSVYQVENAEIWVDRFLFKEGNIWGETLIETSGIAISGTNLDSVRIEGYVEPERWNMKSMVRITDSLSLKAKASGDMVIPCHISLSELNIITQYDFYSLKGEGAQMTIGTNRYGLTGFILTGRENGGSKIEVDGEYWVGDSVLVDVSVDDLDLSLFEKFGLVELPLKGKASLGIHSSGTISDLDLTLMLLLNGVEANPLRVEQIRVNMEQRHDTLRASAVAKSQKGDSLIIDLLSPVQISVGDSQMVASIREVTGKIVAQKVRPSAFFEFENPDNQYVRALVDVDVGLNGPLMHPVLRGFVNITGGEMSIPSYGLAYHDMKLKVRIDSNRIQVDSLYAGQDKGSLLIAGNAAFAPDVVAGNLSLLNLTLKARDFFISRHPNHVIQIDADTWLKQDGGNSVYGGTLTVLRSKLYLPALMDMGGSSKEDEPLLVQSLLKELKDSMVIEDSDIRMEPGMGKDAGDWMKSLKGKINIKIPRNTWLRSEDMNLELYGDVDLLKNDEYFEIFGVLGITRGYYTLYGRKLNIKEGELTFSGGREMNPGIELEAGYTFRGRDKQKKELIMNVSGTAFDPELLFTLNGSAVSERDAMAYLIFNQSFDELSFGNRGGISVNLPTAMVSGLVSAQLTKTIGKQFDLDMLEIQAGDDWESATFMVGKYISNNLFVTYQRGFGVNEDGALFHQTVSLEYEFIRNLFIRLTQGDFKDSGIDVIIKFEKK